MEAGVVKSPRTSKRILAGVCSAVIPGTGQIMLHRVAAGAIWLATFIAFLSLNIVFRPWTAWEGLTPVTWTAFILNTASAYNAAFSRKNGSVSWRVRLWLPLFLLIAVAPSVYLLQLLWGMRGYKSFSVPSTAMELTIIPGDKIVTDTHAYIHSQPHRGDVIIYWKEGTWFVKRVVAVGGDVIESKSSVVFLNGVELHEPFLVHRASPVVSSQQTFGPITVPQGTVFVMGDNRDVSLDSRTIGPVPFSLIRARVLYDLGAVRSGRKDLIQTR